MTILHNSYPLHFLTTPVVIAQQVNLLLLSITKIYRTPTGPQKAWVR